MKTITRFAASAALIFALSLTAWAGDMQFPGVTNPPPPPPPESTTAPSGAVETPGITASAEEETSASDLVMVIESGITQTLSLFF